MESPERSPSPELKQIHGRLHHLKGKTRSIRQTFNADSPVISMGRDLNCDIRIHALDVSRVQCTITFDLLTGKATLEVLSKSGVKVNKTLLHSGTTHVLQESDIITVSNRRFMFEYAEAESTFDPWIPASPMPAASSKDPEDRATAELGSPAKPRLLFQQDGGRGSSRFSSRRTRNSTRLHLFPAHVASEEVKENLAALNGIEEDEVVQEKRHDLSYLEVVEEDEGPAGDILQKIDREAAASPRRTQRRLPSAFATPQPAKRAQRLPRTSLAPRTRKLRFAAEPVAEADEETEAKGSEAEVTEPQIPTQELTPSRIPLPPAENTPYVVQSSIYPSLEDAQEGGSVKSSYDRSQDDESLDTPTPINKYVDVLGAKDDQDEAFGDDSVVTSTPSRSGATNTLFETPRNVPLPASIDTPYTAEASIYHAKEGQEELEDVEMEDMENVQSIYPEVPMTFSSPEPEATSSSRLPAVPEQGQLDVNVSPPTSPAREQLDHTYMMPITPKPWNQRNSLRRNLLLHSSQKVMEAQLIQRRLQQYGQPADGSRRIVAPTPVKLPAQTPSKMALPSPAGTRYASDSESDEEEQEEDVHQDAGEFDDSIDYEDNAHHYETDVPESEVDDSEDEDEEEAMDLEGEVQAPFPNSNANSVSSGSLTPSVRRIIAQEIAVAGDSSDEDVDESLDLRPEDESDEEDYPEEERDELAENMEDMQEEAEYYEEDAGDAPQTVDSNIDPSLVPLPETPAAPRSLGERFFTPQYQARKSARRQGRKSLCDDFGPPVRFRPDLATPIKEAVAKMDSQVEEEEIESDVHEEEEFDEEGDAAAFVKSETADENETPVPESEQVVHETLRRATTSRRELPTPPAQVFEFQRVEDQPILMKLPETPLHPALARSNADEVSSDEEENKPTLSNPLDDIKSQLKALRRKSLHRNSLNNAPSNNRRATVGFNISASPHTPEKKASSQLIFRTATPGARFAHRQTSPSPMTPPQPSFFRQSDIPEQATVSLRDVNPFGAEPASAQNDLGEGSSTSDVSEAADGEPLYEHPESAEHEEMDVEPDEEEEEEEEEEDEKMERQSSPHVAETTETMAALEISDRHEAATPSAVKTSNRKVLETPKLTGLREMYAEIKAKQTPEMSGLKNMFALPVDPKTPDMAGLRHMMAVPTQSATPDFSGLKDVLYEENEAVETKPEIPEEVEDEQSAEEEEEEEEEEEDVIKVASKVPSKAPKNTSRVVTTAASRTRRKVAEPAEDVVESSTAKQTPIASASTARRTRTKVSEEPLDSITVKPRATRTRQAVPVKDTAPAEPVKRTRAKAALASEAPVTAPAARATRAVAAPARATRTRTATAPEAEQTSEKADEAEAQNDEDKVSAKKPAARAARAPVAKTAVARKAAPLKPSTVDNAAAEEEQPKTRATRARVVSVKVEEPQEDVKPVVPKTRTRAAAGESGLTAPTAASKARAASAAAAKKPVATRTRTVAAAPEAPAEPAKRVTRARK